MSRPNVNSPQQLKRTANGFVLIRNEQKNQTSWGNLFHLLAKYSAFGERESNAIRSATSEDSKRSFVLIAVYKWIPRNRAKLYQFAGRTIFRLEYTGCLLEKRKWLFSTSYLMREPPERAKEAAICKTYMYKTENYQNDFSVQNMAKIRKKRRVRK